MASSADSACDQLPHLMDTLTLSKEEASSTGERPFRARTNSEIARCPPKDALALPESFMGYNEKTKVCLQLTLAGLTSALDELPRRSFPPECLLIIVEQDVEKQSTALDCCTLESLSDYVTEQSAKADAAPDDRRAVIYQVFVGSEGKLGEPYRKIRAAHRKQLQERLRAHQEREDEARRLEEQRLALERGAQVEQEQKDATWSDFPDSEDETEIHGFYSRHNSSEDLLQGK
eukprot:GFYU01001774.1.p1 GENE.GFYU01001774.1~~GFYU01001774.1.p1  ORF type:complete len:232 (-),score=55.75 GFYU01001774.1:93-788(-)